MHLRFSMQLGCTSSFLFKVTTAALLVLPAGCSTLKLPEYPTRAVEQQPFLKVQDGLAIGIHPLTDRSECKRYFGTDLLAARLLAIAVTVENRSDGASFVLEKSRFWLGNVRAGGEATKSRIGDETAGLVLASLGGIGTMLAGAKLGSDARIIKHNFAIKELQATTISPGRSVTGLMYFELPKKTTGDQDWAVHIEALDLTTKKYAVIEIPFLWR